MAGSWQHMTTKSGKLRNNETFCDMIENLGDAYEAAEECYGMIQYLAQIYSMDIPGGPWSPEELIKLAQEHYKDGLRLGGVQKPG